MTLVHLLRPLWAHREWSLHIQRTGGVWVGRFDRDELPYVRVESSCPEEMERELIGALRQRLEADQRNHETRAAHEQERANMSRALLSHLLELRGALELEDQVLERRPVRDLFASEEVAREDGQPNAERHNARSEHSDGD